MTNKLEGFLVPYQEKDANGDWVDVTAQKQAQKIIDEIQKRLKNDPIPKGVAITYSANDAQANTLYHGYNDNQYNQGPYAISGGNQATVFQLVQAEIVKRGWQDKVHILPIATSVSGGADYNGDGSNGGLPKDKYISSVTSNMATQAMRERDMANIACHLGAGWDVLGLQNKKTGNPSFAVGGGYSKAWYYDAAAGQGKAAAKAMSVMAKPSFSTDAENPEVVAAAEDAEKKLYAAYQAGKKSGIQIPALKPIAAAADPANDAAAADPAAAESAKAAAPPAPIKYEDLPPANIPTSMLTSFNNAIAKSVSELKGEATKQPVITGDSIDPKFIDLITGAVENHIQEAQAQYAQIKFKPVAAKVPTPGAKPEEEEQAEAKAKSEPIGFYDADEWEKLQEERKQQHAAQVEAATKAGQPAPQPLEEVELIKKYLPEQKEEAAAAVYKAMLYHDVKIEKLKDDKDKVTGYSLSKAGKKILEAKMFLEDDKPKVSVTVYDRSQDAINLTLHQTFLHAQQAGITNPKINIQDEDSPEYAMAMFKAAGKMGITAVIRKETLDKLAEVNPEQRKEYDKIIAARGAGPAPAPVPPGVDAEAATKLKK